MEREREREREREKGRIRERKEETAQDIACTQHIVSDITLCPVSSQSHLCVGWRKGPRPLPPLHRSMPPSKPPATRRWPCNTEGGKRRGEEGVERERERGTHRKSDCVCSKFWVICLLRFLDLGKDGCRNRSCITTLNK